MGLFEGEQLGVGTTVYGDPVGGGGWTGREYEVFQQEGQGLLGKARNKT